MNLAVVWVQFAIYIRSRRRGIKELGRANSLSIRIAQGVIVRVMFDRKSATWCGNGRVSPPEAGFRFASCIASGFEAAQAGFASDGAPHGTPLSYQESFL